MKSVILNGQEVKIGSKIRFVDDRNMYTGVKNVKKPVLGTIYTVRDFSEKGGFLLVEIENPEHNWIAPDNVTIMSTSEPGFAVWRFEPMKPIAKKKVVNIKIEMPVEERLDVPAKNPTTIKKRKKELELFA